MAGAVSAREAESDIVMDLLTAGGRREVMSQEEGNLGPADRCATRRDKSRGLTQRRGVRHWDEWQRHFWPFSLIPLAKGTSRKRLVLRMFLGAG
jgi:hypothetical protein